MRKNELIEVKFDNLIHNGFVTDKEHLFITANFGFIDACALFKSLTFHIGSPYRLREQRLVCCFSGEFRVSINLIEYSVTPGTLLYIYPNSIAQPLGCKPGSDIRIIGASSGFVQMPRDPFFSQHYFDGGGNSLLQLTAEEKDQIDSFYNLIWSILKNPIYQQDVVRNLFTSLLYYVRDVYKHNQETHIVTFSHQEEIFRNFLALVHQHSKEERTVGFYADKLCFSPRYLNTLINQISRHTVMDWINQSVILEAKILLKYSDKLIYQIADDLHFANSSFFCKYFKRLTGMSPLEYQKKE